MADKDYGLTTALEVPGESKGLQQDETVQSDGNIFEVISLAHQVKIEKELTDIAALH